jgi:iron complex outermembrane receptor protein
MLAYSVPSFSQDAVSTNRNSNENISLSTDQNDGLKEIVVTAQRRTESLSRVPVSVAAFDGQDLQQRAITQTNQLQALVPGVTMITTNSSNEFDYAIRGQTVQAYSGSVPSVVVYMNEVPLSPKGTTGGALYDLAGLEVLKGPQGTLFGRNNTGGSVLIKTAKPTNQFEGFFSGRAGSFDHLSAQAAVNVPLIDNVLSIRLAGSLQKEDGYLRNVLNKTTLGDIDHKSMRVSIAFTPTDKLSNLVVFQYDKARGTEGNPQIFSHYKVGQTNNGVPLTSLTESFTNGQQSIYADLAKKNPYELYLLYTGPHKSKNMFFQNTTTYQISDEIQIKNIFGIVNSNSIVSNQLNASPFIILADLDPLNCCEGLNYNQKNWSEELQIQGKTNDGKLSYLVGMFLSSNKSINNWPFTFTGFSFYWRYSTIDYSKAIYSQATYDLSDLTGLPGLSATAGVRYTWERLGANQLPGGINTNAGNVLVQRSNESAPSWQFGLQYQASPSTLLYAVTRGSWRAGGFNNGGPGPDGLGNAFAKETTQDVEMGVKYDGRLADRPFRASLAGFTQWNQGYQATLYNRDANGTPSSGAINVKAARVRGVEFALDTKPFNWLQIGASAAYNDAVFTNPLGTSGGGFIGSLTNFANTPKFSAAAFASVDLPVPDALGSMKIRVDTYSVTETPFSNFTKSVMPDTTLPGYTRLDLRYEWNNVMKTGLNIAAFGQNVFNKQYWIGGFPLGFSQGTNTAIPSKPGSFGLELGYKF